MTDVEIGFQRLTMNGEPRFLTGGGCELKPGIFVSIAAWGTVLCPLAKT